MKRKLDRVAVALGIAGAVIYAHGVDQSMWSRYGCPWLCGQGNWKLHSRMPEGAGKMGI